jgi:hypothetical protein
VQLRQPPPWRLFLDFMALRFLDTKAHCSSNWTSRVQGGKRHQFVVGDFVRDGIPTWPCAAPTD